jgi:uncharacterized SAM-binding protein YcdF (DUF218 family)
MVTEKASNTIYLEVTIINSVLLSLSLRKLLVIQFLMSFAHALIFATASSRDRESRGLKTM